LQVRPPTKNSGEKRRLSEYRKTAEASLSAGDSKSDTFFFSFLPSSISSLFCQLSDYASNLPQENHFHQQIKPDKLTERLGERQFSPRELYYSFSQF
jgi:hypothetical protein